VNTPRPTAIVSVYPGAMSIGMSSAAGNGLLGAFKELETSFILSMRDLYGNPRGFGVPHSVQVYLVDVNVTAAIATAQNCNPLCGLQNQGCTTTSCGSVVAALPYSHYNQSSTPLGISTASPSRIGNTGEYEVTYTPADSNTYHIVIFVDQHRLPLAKCENHCFSQVLLTTTELKRPSSTSITDASRVAVFAGTPLSVKVQLRNSIHYNLFSGGFGGAIVVGTHPNATMCEGRPTLCQDGWLQQPFPTQITDHSDGSYTVSFTPVEPGAYIVHIMANLTHSSLPVVECTPGALTCVTQFAPVCGHDLQVSHASVVLL
jgi:hypothetical protein